MLTTIIIVVAIYFVAMLGIGWYGRRYSSTFDGYLSWVNPAASFS